MKIRYEIDSADRNIGTDDWTKIWDNVCQLTNQIDLPQPRQTKIRTDEAGMKDTGVLTCEEDYKVGALFRICKVISIH